MGKCLGIHERHSRGEGDDRVWSSQSTESSHYRWQQLLYYNKDEKDAVAFYLSSSWPSIILRPVPAFLLLQQHHFVVLGLRGLHPSPIPLGILSLRL